MGPMMTHVAPTGVALHASQSISQSLIVVVLSQRRLELLSSLFLLGRGSSPDFLVGFKLAFISTMRGERINDDDDEMVQSNARDWSAYRCLSSSSFFS